MPYRTRDRFRTFHDFAFTSHTLNKTLRRGLGLEKTTGFFTKTTFNSFAHGLLRNLPTDEDADHKG